MRLVPGPLARGAAAAPAALSDCILATSQSSVDVVASRVYLLRSDGTYQSISISQWVSTRVFTQPPEAGAYVYSVDPTTANHATVTFNPAGGASHSADLYFTGASGGNLGAFPLSSFTVSTRQSTNGGGNASSLGWITPTHGTTVGFVVSGASRWVLIRALGPALVQFGLAPAIASPSLAVYRGATSLGVFGTWSADPNLVPGFKTAFALAGAFALPDGTADSVAILSLAPGAYTATCSSTGDSGNELTEVYFLPY